jgi:very-short-patch-repair endonuclease
MKKPRKSKPSPHGPVKVIFSAIGEVPTNNGNWTGLRATDLRLKAPKCEHHLRNALKELEAEQVFFFHSVPMDGWILDFYCPEYKLIVELDGPFHKMRRESDRNRDVHFYHKGIRTLRFPSWRAHHSLDYILANLRREIQIKKGQW